MGFSSGKNVGNNVNLTEAQTLQNKTLDNTNSIDGASLANSTLTDTTINNATIDSSSVTNPDRLDPKKDTRANLDVYATTAQNGELVFATDEKQAYQVVDGELVSIGGSGIGGGGGTSFDENQVAHGLAVLDAIYHNGTSWVKAQANDAATLATHIVSAVANVDNFTAQNFGRFEATAHGKTVGEFYFLSESVAGGSDTVEGSVYSAPLYYVEDANTIHALVYRPSLRPQNVQFREDVDVLENILAFDTTSAGFSTEIAINGESFRLTHDASLTRFAEVDLAVTPKFRDKILELPVDLKSTASSGNFKVVITDLTNAKTLADEVLQPQSGSETVKRVVSFSTKPVDGDLAIETIRVRFEALAESGAISDFDDVLVQLKKTQSLEVIAIEQEENVFSARIENNGSASVVSQSSPFIAAVNRTAPGVVNITFKSGLFTQTPIIVTSSDSDNNGIISTRRAESSTGVDIVTYTTAGGGIDNNFDITVQRQGSDYRNLTRRVEREVSTFKEVLVEEADSNISHYGQASKDGNNVVTLTTLLKNLGSAITFNNGEYLVNESGIYSVDATVAFQGTDNKLLLTKNSLTTTNNSPDVLMWGQTENTGGYQASLSWTGYVKKGDVLRLTTPNTIDVTTSSKISVSKQGSLKKASVAPDSKIKIPTSELRMEGSTGMGTGAEAFTVAFQTLSKIRGDAFSVSNSNGTVITVLKDGMVTLNADARVGGVLRFGVSLNTADASTYPTNSEMIINEDNRGASANDQTSCNGSFFVKAGDIIRVWSDGSILSTSANGRLEITHQEQDISVAVSNVTPQFEDADSMVRVSGSLGYGSSATKIRRFSSVEDNIGSDITYTDSATDGASFTVNVSGVYHISYSDEAGAVISDYLGISKNSNQLTTDIFSISATSRLAIGSVGNEDGEYRDTISWSGYLQKGDVIRPHGTGTLASSPNTLLAQFTIVRQGKPSIAEVDVTPFVNLDQYRTKYHSVRAEGNGGEAITVDVTPIPFTEVTDTAGAWDGDEYTVQKPNSTITISGSLYFTTSAARGVHLFKNNVLYKRINSFGTTATAISFGYKSTRGEFSVGDVLEIRSNDSAGTLNNDSKYHYLNIVEEYEEEGRSKFHSIAQTENEFSARISAAGAVLSESQNFIDTVLTAGTQFNITFVSGFFSEIPSITATKLLDGTPGEIDIESVSTSNVVINTRNSSGTPSLYGFNLHVSRQGADRKDLQKAIVQLSDFPKVNRTLKQSFLSSTGSTQIGSNIEYSPAINGDSLISYDSSTAVYTCLRNKVTVNLSASAAGTSPDNCTILLNGTPVGRQTSTTGYFSGASFDGILNAGDTLEVAIGGTLSGSANTLSMVAEAQELERISNVEADGEYAYCPFNDFFWDGAGDQYTFDISLVNGYSANLNLFEFEDNFVNAGGFATATILRAKKDIELHVQIGGRPNTSFLIIYNSAGESLAHGGAANQPEGATTSIKLAKDDYIFFRTVNNNTQSGFISILAKPSLSSVVVGLNPVKFQTKTLSANFGGTGVATDLTFNNLVVGKTYRLTGFLNIDADEFSSNAKRMTASVLNGATQIQNFRARSSNVFEFNDTCPINRVFVATASTVTFQIDQSDNVTIASDSAVTLEELPEAVETTDFS